MRARWFLLAFGRLVLCAVKYVLHGVLRTHPARFLPSLMLVPTRPVSLGVGTDSRAYHGIIRAL